MKKILLIVSVMYYGLFTYGENHSEPQSQFRKIIEKYKKTPNADFQSEIEYIKTNIKNLSKEKAQVKLEILDLLAIKHPDIIINWIENDTINYMSENNSDKESMIMAVIDTFKTIKEKKAVNLLKKLIKSKQHSPEVIFSAGTAYDYITGNYAKEKYDKKTPKLFILSLNTCINKNKSELVSEEEQEFYMYPRYSEDFWRNEQKPKMLKAQNDVKRFHKLINKLADDIINNDGKNIEFIKTKSELSENSAIIIIKFKNKKVLELYKDCFGQWRF